ncbi:MAG: 50S ribosomal protein L39e [Candidatus Heimdallarchaeaceae archaeon]
MARNRSLSRKVRYAREMEKSAAVPSWIVIRTNRKVRTHPKRRKWRSSRIKR